MFSAYFVFGSTFKPFMAFELLMGGGGRGPPGTGADPLLPVRGPSSFSWYQLKCDELGIRQAIPLFALGFDVCCPFNCLECSPWRR